MDIYMINIIQKLHGFFFNKIMILLNRKVVGFQAQGYQREDHIFLSDGTPSFHCAKSLGFTKSRNEKLSASLNLSLSMPTTLSMTA